MTSAPDQAYPEIFDQETMKHSFGGDREFTCATMRIYMRGAPALAEKALAAIKGGDNEALAVNAHALKGITSYFTRREMFRLCLTLEHLGRDNALPPQAVNALGTWAQMSAGLKEMLAAMERYLSEGGSGARRR